MSLDSAHRVGVLIRHNLILRLRDPGQLISYLLLPMIVMVVFKPLYTKAFADSGTIQVVTGPLIMFSVFTLSLIGNSILVEREWRTWDRLRTSAASTTELLLGKIVPLFLTLLAQQSVLLVYGCLVVGLPFPRSPGLVAVSIVIWGLVLLSIGAAMSTLLRSHGELAMVSDIGAITISAFGGALIPVALMPGWAAVIAHISPGFWGLTMLQAAVRGDTEGMLRPAGILLAVALIAGVLAIRRLAKGWGRSALL